MSDIINILNLILREMTKVEQFLNFSGDDKKKFVITLLEKELPNYAEYKDMIPMVIELVIIMLSKTKIAINNKPPILANGIRIILKFAVDHVTKTKIVLLSSTDGALFVHPKSTAPYLPKLPEKAC